MRQLNPGFEKALNYMIYGTLMVLALGLVTSMSLLSLSHVLMVVPGIYFLSKMKFRELPISAYFLMALIVAIALSIICNQDIMVDGYKPLGKIKYFIFGILMIYPFNFYFNNYKDDKKIGYLLYAFCIATTVATIAGIIGMNTGYNYISMRTVNLDRNAGLSGMVLNYAHNLAYFQIIVFGLIIFKKNLVTIINKNFLYIIFAINILGLYLSYTRGAIIALVLGLPFYFFKKSKLKFVVFGLALIVMASVGYYLGGRTLIRPGSDNERISQWQAAIKAFEERPVLGYGYLNFEKYSVPIKERYNLGQLQFGGHAHNNFLEILATTGIVGFVFYLGWLGVWFMEVYKRDDILAKISLPFIIVFIVSGLTQSTISLGVNLFFVMAVYALGQAIGPSRILKK